MTVFVKIAGEEIATIQIVFIRGVITLVFTFIMIKKKNIFLWGKNRKLLSLRGIVGSIALFFVFESLNKFSIPEATVIQYLYPIFTAILATVLLNEIISKKLYISIILGLIGIYIILGFPFLNLETSINLSHLFIAITGSFLTGLAYVLVRMSSNSQESPYVIMFYFPLYTVLLSAPFIYNYWVSPSIYYWIIIILVGVCTQFGQLFLTFGYKLLPASKAAPTSYVQVPFAAIASAVIFNDTISFNFILGSIIIFFGIYLIISQKQKSIIKLS